MEDDSLFHYLTVLGLGVGIPRIASGLKSTGLAEHEGGHAGGGGWHLVGCVRRGDHWEYSYQMDSKCQLQLETGNLSERFTGSSFRMRKSAWSLLIGTQQRHQADWIREFSEQVQSLGPQPVVLPVKTWHNQGWEVLLPSICQDLCQTHFLTH